MHLLEPYRSRFVRLLERGAAAQDIFAENSELVEGPGTRLNESFVQRELDRVEMHGEGFVALLVANGVTCKRVLDVGCGTGGSTAAIALSEGLQATEVFGVDPNPLSIEAAEVRAEGLGIADRTTFETIVAGQLLRFAEGEFDLVVSVSVLEFIPSVAGRRQFLAELERVASPGGFIFVSTPSTLRLRELHSGRWFGNFMRSEIAPWPSPARFICRSLRCCTQVPTKSSLAGLVLKRKKLSMVPALIKRLVALALALTPWQKLLFVKRFRSGTGAFDGVVSWLIGLQGVTVLCG